VKEIFGLLFANLSSPLVAIPFLVAVWIGSCWSISAFSGWRALSARFLAQLPVQGAKYRFVSASMRSGSLPTRFNNCLDLTIAPDGFGLSMLFVVRLFHPALYFPWAAVRSMHAKSGVVADSAIVMLRDQPQEIVFYGHPARALLAAFQQREDHEPSGI
jgi:hypothetical protein